MVPMSRKMGLSKRIHDGYVLTEDEKITEAGEYTKEKGDQIIRDYGNDLFVVGSEKQGGFTIDGKKQTDFATALPFDGEHILKVGKLRWAKLIIK